MFLRYFGGGLGHLSQVPLATGESDAMDVDAPSTEESPESAPVNDRHQLHQLERLVQQAVDSSSEGSQELDPDQDLSDGDSTASSGSGDDLGDSSDYWDDSEDLGPEDGEGIGDERSDDGYGSP
jgi:hypothetical protein